MYTFGMEIIVMVMDLVTILLEIVNLLMMNTTIGQQVNLMILIHLVVRIMDIFITMAHGMIIQILEVTLVDM